MSCARKCDCMTPLSREPQRLPVKERIEFHVLLSVIALNDKAPTNLKKTQSIQKGIDTEDNRAYGVDARHFGSSSKRCNTLPVANV